MSERNGDRARFQKDRKRKLRHRQRIHALAARMRKPASQADQAAASPPPAPAVRRVH